MKKVDDVGDSFDGTLSLDLVVKATSASPSRPTGSITRVQQKLRQRVP